MEHKRTFLGFHPGDSVLISFNCQVDVIRIALKRVSLYVEFFRSGWPVGMSGGFSRLSK